MTREEFLRKWVSDEGLCPLIGAHRPDPCDYCKRLLVDLDALLSTVRREALEAMARDYGLFMEIILAEARAEARAAAQKEVARVKEAK